VDSISIRLQITKNSGLKSEKNNRRIN
jgi:hypothetical protein